MCFAVYCRRSSITRFHRNGESTPPYGHPRLVLIRLVAFLCVMVTCRLVTMFLIQPAVDESRGYWSIASELALKDTLSKAPSMSRKVPRTYPFLAILFSILCMTLWSAVSVDVPFLKPNCFLLRLSSIPRSCCMCHSMTFSWSLRRVGERVIVRYELGLL